MNVSNKYTDIWRVLELTQRISQRQILYKSGAPRTASIQTPVFRLFLSLAEAKTVNLALTVAFRSRFNGFRALAQARQPKRCCQTEGIWARKNRLVPKPSILFTYLSTFRWVVLTTKSLCFEARNTPG